MNLLWLRRAFLAAVGSLVAVRGAALRGSVWLSRGFLPRLSTGFSARAHELRCVPFAARWHVGPSWTGGCVPCMGRRFLTPGPQGSLRNMTSNRIQ